MLINRSDMEKTMIEITKMDCPSEERMIRMKLEGLSTIRKLEFDIPQRKLTVLHDGGLDQIVTAVHALSLGDRVLSTEETTAIHEDKGVESSQRRILIWVLIINFSFFVIEMVTGLLSRSMGLVADSLDMLADAFVYGLSLLVVGSNLIRKKKIARLAGYFQIILALIGFAEVIRRVVMQSAMPDFSTMIIVSVLALMANAACLYLLHQSKGKEEAHMKASLIFTANDVIINMGVIVSAVLVYWLQSGIPDLLVAAIVFIIVLRGAFRILKLGKN